MKLLQTHSLAHTPFLDRFLERTKALSFAIPTGTYGIHVEDCIDFLAGVCDGAVKKDDQGFSVTDAPDGHRIAGKIQAGYALTKKERSRSIELLVTYHERQLSERFEPDVIAELLKKPRFKFREDTGSCDVPHVAMRDQSGQVWIEIPPLSSGATEAMLADLVSIARATGYSICNQQTLEAREKGEKIRPDGRKLKLLVGDRNVQQFIGALAQLGFTVDSRVHEALNSVYNGLLFAKLNRVDMKDGGKRDILYCQLQERKPGVNFKPAADALLRSFGLFSERNVAKRTVSFPLGVKIMPALRDFCGMHKVGLFANAEHALAREDYHSLQRKVLRAEDHPHDLVKPENRTTSGPKRR
jgi:hypothetical protein